jgi:hypothetical protein
MKIGTVTASVAIRGTLVSVKPQMTSDKVKINEPLYHILVPTSTLVKKKVDVYRGVRVSVGSRIFEVVIDGSGSSYPEEQYKDRTIIVCKEIKC